MSPPVTDRYVAFAQAVIALCREHGANNISVQFSLNGGKLWPPGNDHDTGWPNAKVTFQWGEGSHGSPSHALLHAETHLSIDEPEPSHDQSDGR